LELADEEEKGRTSIGSMDEKEEAGDTVSKEVR